MGSLVPVLMIGCPIATVTASSGAQESGSPFLRSPLLPPCSWKHSELFEEEVERIWDDSRSEEKHGQHWEDSRTCPEPPYRARAMMPSDLTPNNGS